MAVISYQLNTKYCTETGALKLDDGRFEEFISNHEGTLSLCCETWMEDVFAIGDLNRDGVTDAAIIVCYTGGGSGTFLVFHLLVQREGRFADKRSYSLGDRVIIHSLSIEAGEVFLDITRHGPNDPAYLPTNRQLMPYVLQ